MHTNADKTQENKSQLISRDGSQTQGHGKSTFQFDDNRPEAIAQRKLQEMANNSPQISQLRAFQDLADNSPQVKRAAQLQAIADDHSIQQQQPIQKKENNTGLPDMLKTGIENLSGYSMDDVKVHYNSGKPAQLQAHAYAQGTDIHLASGQEKHLPHEAWHVVQQKQGRVKPTMQLKDIVNINDDTYLEKEADVMGTKMFQFVDLSPDIVAQRKQRDIAVSPLSSKPIIQKLKYDDKEIKSLIELNQICDEHKPELKLSTEDFSDYTTAEIDSAIANTSINIKHIPEKEMLKSSLLIFLKKLALQRPKIIGKTSQIIQTGFQKVIAGIEDEIKTIIGATSEQVIENGLRQATKHLLQFYEEQSASKFKFPSPELLNVPEDVGNFESILMKTETDFQDDDYMHYWTIKEMKSQVVDGNYKDAIAKELGKDKLPEVEQSDIMQERRQRSNRTTVGRWAEVANHYIKLKGAFLNSWQENEHGELKNRAFYYLLKRMPQEAYNEMAGNSDVQAAIGAPKSGHVALGIGLEEVFDTAACHEDALQLVELLGAQVTARGEAQGPEAEKLHSEEPKIFAAIETSKTDVTGVRLKDASNHSVVLLFEKTPDGWQGNTYETIAGQNTESIMAFREGLNPRPLKEAKSLLKAGLGKAVQISNDKWKLEWEVFEVAEPNEFAPRLFQHVGETLKGVKTGLDKKKEESEKMDAALDYEAQAEQRAPEEWMGKETDEHMNKLRAQKK